MLMQLKLIVLFEIVVCSLGNYLFSLRDYRVLFYSIQLLMCYVFAIYDLICCVVKCAHYISIYMLSYILHTQILFLRLY